MILFRVGASTSSSVKHSGAIKPSETGRVRTSIDNYEFRPYGKGQFWLSSAVVCYIAHDDSFSPTKELTKKIIAWNKEMSKKGFDSNPLVPPDEWITIRIRSNKINKTKGSFSASKEKIAAYVLVECSSQDEAFELAEKHPMAKASTIEVRRVWKELSSL